MNKTISKMSEIRLRKDIKIKQRLVLATIILLPLFTIDEQLYYYGFSDSMEVMSQGIKMIKDLMFAAIYIVSFYFYQKRGKLPKTFAYFLPFYILLMLCFIATTSRQAGLAGLRWCHVFFLSLCLYGCVDDNFMIKTCKLFRMLLVVQVASQIFELFYMPPLGGYNSMGLANRVPGIFVHASAAGAFASLNYLFMVLYREYISKKTFRVTFIMLIASQIMAMSSTGIALLIGLIFFEKYQKHGRGKIILVLFILLCPIIWANLDFLAGREAGDSDISGGTRLGIMGDALDKMELVSTKFGLATNTAVSMKLPHSEIVDGSYISLLSNVGLLGLLYIIIPLIYLFLKSINTGNKRLTLSMIWILGVSFPIITMELFPFNLIVAILLNYWLFNKNKNSRTVLS